MNTRIMRLPEVIQVTGLSRASIYKAIAIKQFPSQVKIGGSRSVGWLADEVQAYLENCIKVSRG